MGLFDRFRKNATQPSGRKTGLGYGSPEEEKFWQLYVESLHFKDQGKLKSALEKREEARAKYCPNPGYEGMACHNLAILTMYHLGMGQAAAKYARESLAFGDDYYRCSKEHMDELRFGAHLESLQTAMMTAASYDEALEYGQQGAELYGGIFETKIKEMNEFQAEYPRYSDYQRQTSLLYYSRVSAELDQGDYAPAMSLLQLLLDRAEEPAYDLSYEEYVDILDDYGTISVMYLMKKARVLGGTREDFAKELAFIADEPLHRLAAFLPDCEPADRQKFENIISAFRTFPGIPDRDSFRPFQ